MVAVRVRVDGQDRLAGQGLRGRRGCRRCESGVDEHRLIVALD